MATKPSLNVRLDALAMRFARKLPGFPLWVMMLMLVLCMALTVVLWAWTIWDWVAR